MTECACPNFTFVLSRFLSSNKELSAFLNKIRLGGEAFPEVYKGRCQCIHILFNCSFCKNLLRFLYMPGTRCLGHSIKWSRWTHSKRLPLYLERTTSQIDFIKSRIWKHSSMSWPSTLVLCLFGDRDFLWRPGCPQTCWFWPWTFSPASTSWIPVLHAWATLLRLSINLSEENQRCCQTLWKNVLWHLCY